MADPYGSEGRRSAVSPKQMKMRQRWKAAVWGKVVAPLSLAALYPVVALYFLSGVAPAQAKAKPAAAGTQAVALPKAGTAASNPAIPNPALSAASPVPAGGTPATGATGVQGGAAVLRTDDARPSEGAAALEVQIARLPELTGTDIDVAKRSNDILQHLNGVLRFYRTAIAPVQKVGEPSDVLYAEQSSTQALGMARVAFQAAANEATLLGKISGVPAQAAAARVPLTRADGGEAQRFNTLQTQTQAKLAALLAQQTSLLAAIAKTRGSATALQQQQEQQLEGGIELQRAMVTALDNVASLSDGQSHTGLVGDIDRLQRSAPELLSTGVKPPTPPLLSSLAAVRDAGVTTQAETLFQLLATIRTIEDQIKAVDTLRSQAIDLRTPFFKVLRVTMNQGQALTQQGVNASDANAAPTAAANSQTLASIRQQFDSLTNVFEVLANATLPLSQEIILLENARGTLTTWRAAVNEEETSILRALLIRVVIIAVLLGLVALASRLWSQATVRYVSDLRRRRQLLFVRRAVMGFLSGLVVVFGFVTQFSSLATFAGFISAGIAVGLQSILLSVAAYFFIVGRYGVRVGDRITVAGVTGDVIEVGLVRFYVMELVGTGTELHSTGRVAVFANSILFQSGTPIYKQMPGTEYAWHELTAKLTTTADVPAVTKALLEAIDDVYVRYKERIEAQHRDVEGWIGTALPAPEVTSRLQLVDGGLQFAALFPVEISGAAATDQSIAEDLVKRMGTDGPLKAGMTELPVIKAAVKT